MIDEILVCIATPMVVVGAFSSAACATGACRRVAHAHLLCMSVLCVAYAYLRNRFMHNVREPLRDVLDARCTIYQHEGMRVAHYKPPNVPKQKVLLFPGVCNSVRRMLRHAFVAPLLDDSVIFCTQPRGIGDSDTSVHMNRMTMLQDALAAYELSLPFDLPVHVIGYSAGSFMAMQLCATLANDEYATLTVVGGMYDNEDMALDMRICCIALRMRQDDLTLRVHNPVLLVHSSDDAHIGIAEAERHAACRRDAGLPVQLLRVRGEHHEYELSSTDARKFRASVLERGKERASRA